AATIDFPQQIQDRILESQLVDDLKMKLSGMQEENDKLKRVSIRSSQLLEYEKLLEYDGFKSSFFQLALKVHSQQTDFNLDLQALCSIDHPLNDGTSSSSSDTKIIALDLQKTGGLWILPPPKNLLMSGQPATSTWNSLDEQRFSFVPFVFFMHVLLDDNVSLNAEVVAIMSKAY
ncbi:hypothetical protein Tco_1250823, partial [Tanacetum coccineum]